MTDTELELLAGLVGYMDEIVKAMRILAAATPSGSAPVIRICDGINDGMAVARQRMQKIREDAAKPPPKSPPPPAPSSKPADDKKS